MRGFLAGGLWGLVIGGVAVGGVSLVNPPPVSGVADPVAENETPPTDDAVVALPDSPVITAPTEAAPVTDTPVAEAPVSVEPAPETVRAPEADAAPAIADSAAGPETSESVGTEDSTVAGAAVEDSDVSAEDAEGAVAEDNAAPATVDAEVIASVTAPNETAAPVLPDTTSATDPVTTVPEIVQSDSEGAAPVIVADTAPATAPAVSDASALETPAQAPEPADIATVLDAPVRTAGQTQVPAAPAPDPLDSVANDATRASLSEPEVTLDAPENAPAPSGETAAPTVVATADPAPLTPQEPISPATPTEGDVVPTADTGSADAETAEVVEVIDTPVVSVLPSGNTGVRVNRLVSSSDAENETDEAPETVEADPDAPAVERFAAAYSNPDGLPEMSVVLTDDGSFDGAIAAVAGIPFPVTVMLNPTSEGTADRMSAYRAAGIEVGLLAQLPPAATASDVAVYFEAALGAVPEAVAVLDAAGATQGDADVIWQTVSALAEDGLGLITVPRGLNSAPRVAAENGVASGVIFRDIDADGQDARVIRRFMDQAAFRARQTTGVIMLGQVRAETISALIQWGAANRASTVAVVPASAALTTE